MNEMYERMVALEYRLKNAERMIAAFKSGDKYVQIQAEAAKNLRSEQNANKKLKQELEESRRQTVRVRNIWFQTCCDLEKKCAKLEQALNKEIARLTKRIYEVENQRDEALNKVADQRKQIYALATNLEEEKGKNQKLTAQINRDYENSSIPSSQSRRHKKIENSREKTGRKPGGQVGHAHHGRKKQTPTKPTAALVPSQEVLDDPDFKPTGKFISKQLVSIRMILDVTEYTAEIYRDSKTGERYHAPFPDNVVDDVNYDGSIKAFLFMLNNDCCVSIDKCSRFLSELTDGKLKISKGMINKLSKEFSMKTENERKKLFSDMLLTPVMHVDCTNAKVNGNSAYVFVNATPDGKVYYSASTKKGHEGVKGTPVENYQGILVHDHESTFYKYGSNHQECLAHVLRYLKDSMENEKNRTWSTKMRALIQEMIHYRKELDDDAAVDMQKVKAFEDRYREILQTARDEYEYEPPTKYYKEGYNLWKRLDEFMSNHFLFLYDHRVDTTNNISERLLRIIKRKIKQAVSYRSQDNLDYLCRSMSMLIMMRENAEMNTFIRISEIFA